MIYLMPINRKGSPMPATTDHQVKLQFLRDEVGNLFECDIWLDTEENACQRAAVAPLIIDEEPVRCCLLHYRHFTEGRVKDPD
jgi:hypothetical protein